MSLPEQTGYKLIGDIDTDGKKVQNLPAPSSDGEAVRATTKITESNLEDAVDKKHSQNTDVALRTDKLTVDASGNTEIVGKLTFADLEALTSIWYYCKYMDAINLASGGSGATQVMPTANTLGGYQLDSATEYLYFNAKICNHWDEASDIEVRVTFEVNIDNSGGEDTDTVDLGLLAYYKGTEEIVNKSQILEIATVVGKSAQYKQFTAVFNIDYDKVDNIIEVGDKLAIRLNLETDTSEVANITINFVTISYKIKSPQVKV